MWLILSFINALASGLQNTYYKKFPSQTNPITTIWYILVVSSVFFSPLFLFGIPHLNNVFWIAVFLRLILDTIAFSLYVKGVSMSPLSLAIPMLALEPVALIVTQMFINHLLPSSLGIVGIISTISGIYLLNFDHNTNHPLSPLRAIFNQTGVRYVAITALLWSIVVSLQKLAIDNSNPYFYTAFFQVLWAICLTPIVLIIDKKRAVKIFKISIIKHSIPTGFLDAVQVFSQYIAYTLAMPVYVIAISNTSILFSSFFGWLFFKEKIHKHILPTVLVVIGIIAISLAQK